MPVPIVLPPAGELRKVALSIAGTTTNPQLGFSQNFSGTGYSTDFGGQYFNSSAGVFAVEGSGLSNGPSGSTGGVLKFLDNGSTVTFSNGRTITFVYDSQGNVWGYVDGRAVTTDGALRAQDPTAGSSGRPMMTGLSNSYYAGVQYQGSTGNSQAEIVAGDDLGFNKILSLTDDTNLDQFTVGGKTNNIDPSKVAFTDSNLSDTSKDVDQFVTQWNSNNASGNSCFLGCTKTGDSFTIDVPEAGTLVLYGARTGTTDATLNVTGDFASGPTSPTFSSAKASYSYTFNSAGTIIFTATNDSNGIYFQPVNSTWKGALFDWGTAPSVVAIGPGNTLTVTGGNWDSSNQSQVWSDTITIANGSEDPNHVNENAFDGVLDSTSFMTCANNGGTAVATYTFSPPIGNGVDDVVEIAWYRGGSVSVNPQVNGSDEPSVVEYTTAQQWFNAGSQLVSLGLTHNAGAGAIGVYGIRLNGRLLVDAINDSQVWSDKAATGSSPLTGYPLTYAFNGDLTSTYNCCFPDPASYIELLFTEFAD